jgi:uncharacterized membrane protein
MKLLADVLTVVTLVGSGVVTGILLIFSNTVMPSLARFGDGAATMVEINERIVNPLFLGLFAGTAAACLALLILTLLGHGPGGGITVAGCGLYLVGVFGITAVVNVPMNEALAALPAGTGEASAYWARYLERWTLWNTVRTLLGMVATTLLALALVAARGAALM